MNLHSASLFLVLISLGAIAWGIRLRTRPERYNPNSMLHRQLYLWYVGWFGKKLDDSYQLERDEVRKSGLVIALISVVSLILAVWSL